MNEQRKTNELYSKKVPLESKFFDDILSFDYYNYKLENLAKKIKSKNAKTNMRVCN